MAVEGFSANPLTVFGSQFLKLGGGLFGGGKKYVPPQPLPPGTPPNVVNYVGNYSQNFSASDPFGVASAAAGTSINEPGVLSTRAEPPPAWESQSTMPGAILANMGGFALAAGAADLWKSIFSKRSIEAQVGAAIRRAKASGTAVATGKKLARRLPVLGAGLYILGEILEQGGKLWEEFRKAAAAEQKRKDKAWKAIEKAAFKRPKLITVSKTAIRQSIPAPRLPGVSSVTSSASRNTTRRSTNGSRSGASGLPKEQKALQPKIITPTKAQILSGVINPAGELPAKASGAAKTARSPVPAPPKAPRQIPWAQIAQAAAQIGLGAVQAKREKAYLKAIGQAYSTMYAPPGFGQFADWTPSSLAPGIGLGTGTGLTLSNSGLIGFAEALQTSTATATKAGEEVCYQVCRRRRPRRKRGKKTKRICYERKAT